MTMMTGSKLSIFSQPGKITGYWITTRSFPYRGPYWPGPIWASTSSGYHPSTHIDPRLRLGPTWGSRDDNQANMEMPMY